MSTLLGAKVTDNYRFTQSIRAITEKLLHKYFSDTGHCRMYFSCRVFWML